MKKILVAATAAVALATPALALDVKWSGDFNHRFMYSNQADLAGSFSPEGYNDAGHFTNERIITIPTKDAGNLKNRDFFGELKYRPTLTATDDDKKVKGVFGLEIGALKFGQSPTTAASGNTGAPFAGDLRETLELRWAYTDFEVPFDTASRLSLGLMPVGYNKFLWSDNAAGVKWSSKRGNLGYSLGWFRDDVTNGGRGGATRGNKDDVYAADVTFTVPNGPKLNAFVLYYELRNQGTVAAPIDGVEGGVMDKRMYYGLAGEGQVGALFYGFTGIYLGGEVVAPTGETFGATAFNTLDRKAYLLNAEATYKLDKYRFKAGWLYSTGDDQPTDGDVENFINIDAYMGGFGSVVVFDSLADDNTMIPTPYIRSRGLNMPYLSADYDMNDKTSFGASYLWIAAAEDILNQQGLNGDTFLGHELAVRAKTKITKNLTAAIEAGYLISGDAWDNLDPSNQGDNVFRTDVGFRYIF